MDISAFLLRAILSAGTLIFCACAGAQSPENSEHPADSAMKVEVGDLLETIGKISDYSIPHSPPPVFVISQHQLESKLCDLPCNATAAYFPREGIYLAGHLVPLRDISAQAALVHELVHFLQQGHAKFAHFAGCGREMEKEREAFEIQNAYFAHMGKQKRVTFFEGIYECSNR